MYIHFNLDLDTMQNLLTLLKPTIALASAALLANCDGPAPRTAADDLSLDARYDVAELSANSTDTVLMPSFLEVSDIITHNLSASTDELGPIFVNEIHSNQGLSVNSIGQLFTTEGAITAPTIVHNYETTSDRTIGIFSLSPNNGWASTVQDSVVEADFNDRIAALVAAGAGSADSLHEALNNSARTDTELTPALMNAIGSLSLVASENADIDHLTPHPDQYVTQVLVLRHRDISYTPTSTNADLLNSNIISGTFVMTESYMHVVIVNDDTGLNRVIFDPDAFPSGDSGSFSKIDTEIATSGGSFTIQINQL